MDAIQLLTNALSDYLWDSNINLFYYELSFVGYDFKFLLK